MFLNFKIPSAPRPAEIFFLGGEGKAKAKLRTLEFLKRMVAFSCLYIKFLWRVLRDISSEKGHTKKTAILHICITSKPITGKMSQMGVGQK